MAKITPKPYLLKIGIYIINVNTTAEYNKNIAQNNFELISFNLV